MGGANEAVINMLEKIGTKEKVSQFVADVKAKKNGVRLMGFGHRVYTNYDPRARVMKKLVVEVLEKLENDDPMLGVAMELEKVALEDPYFVQRKLYPNVDYYSGIMLRALGIPLNMFTVMFAMSRTVGWVSHWKEMVTEGQLRICRPRQLYLGVEKRDFMPMSASGKSAVGDESPAPRRMSSFSYQQAKKEESEGNRTEWGAYSARGLTTFKTPSVQVQPAVTR